VGRIALRRGAWILGLAFLFRLQSWIISGGEFPGTLLKVDILNVMAVSMMGAAAIWRLGRNDLARATLFAAVTVSVAMITPLVREAEWLAILSDPVERYLRPAPGSSAFTLFPWAGFLTAGAAVGMWLDRSRETERQTISAITAVGLAVVAAGYAASLLPAIYANSSFWTSSPTFFFIRLGVVIAATGAAYAITRVWPGPALVEFGRASLFVYWIHVEMAYGVLSTPLHRRLPLETAFVALILFGVFLFLLVRLKAKFVDRGRSPEVRDAGPFQPVRSPVP
jgi:uncharacterized membrane protein